MKRSALLLATAILVSAYALGLIAYIAYTSTYANIAGDWVESLIASFNNALLAGHSFSIFIAAILLWAAYFENNAICAAIAGILLAAAAFEFVGAFSFVISLALSALSFFSIKGAIRNKELIKKCAEEKEARREARALQAQDAKISDSPSENITVSSDGRQVNDTESTHNRLRNAAFTVLFLLLATALVYFGPRALIWYENLLNQILEWSKSIA